MSLRWAEKKSALVYLGSLKARFAPETDLRWMRRRFFPEQEQCG